MNHMKTIQSFIFSAIIGALFSCSANSGQDGTAPEGAQLDTAVSFSGCWVSEDYYNSIQQFKSPKKSQNGSQFIVIPERTLQQTTIVYDCHDGGPSVKVMKNVNGYEIWWVRDSTLTQRMCSVETISSTKLKLNNDVFVKINPLKGENNYRILEEILFKGQYTNAEGQTIEFKNDGQVVGLGNFKFYDPIIDYYDIAKEVDQVGLGSSQKDIEWHGFKFNKDTLELYKLNCLKSESDRCVEVGYGQLAYKLWRKGQ